MLRLRYGGAPGQVGQPEKLEGKENEKFGSSAGRWLQTSASKCAVKKPFRISLI